MKYKVLRSFGGTYSVKGKDVHISAGVGDIIELPAAGHDFEQAGLVERVPEKTKVTVPGTAGAVAVD